MPDIKFEKEQSAIEGLETCKKSSTCKNATSPISKLSRDTKQD